MIQRSSVTIPVMALQIRPFIARGREAELAIGIILEVAVRYREWLFLRNLARVGTFLHPVITPVTAKTTLSSRETPVMAMRCSSYIGERAARTFRCRAK